MPMIAAPIQHRKKCRNCNWDGPESEATEQVRGQGGKSSRKCPKCGVAWVRKYDEQFKCVIGSGTLIGYAVHETCGKQHFEGTVCPTT